MNNEPTSHRLLDLISRLDAIKQAQEFLQTADKPQILPIYNFMHVGIGGLSLRTAKESDTPTVLHFPLEDKDTLDEVVEFERLVVMDTEQIPELVEFIDKHTGRSINPEVFVLNQIPGGASLYLAALKAHTYAIIPLTLVEKSEVVRILMDSYKDSAQDVYRPLIEDIVKGLTK